MTTKRIHFAISLLRIHADPPAHNKHDNLRSVTVRLLQRHKHQLTQLTFIVSMSKKKQDCIQGKFE